MTADAGRRDRTPLALLEIATLLSGIGNGVALVALPWLALQLTGTATAASVVATATAVPLVASSLFSGTVVDLVGRRATAVGSDVASALSVAAIPLLAAATGLTLPALALLAALGAVFDPAGATARESLLPDAAARAGLDLEQANAVHEAIWGSAFLVGPAVGGVLIGVAGPTTTLWLAAAGFAVAVTASALVRVPGAGRPPRDARDGGVWRGTTEGLRFVWHDRLLRDMSLFSMALVAAYLPIEGVLLPVYFEQQGAPERLGVVLMALSAGGIVGALAYGRWGRRYQRRAIFVVAVIGASVAMVVVGLLPPFVTMVAASGLVGLLYGPVDPLISLAMQTRAPPLVRGRVLGVRSAAEYAAGPLGLMAAGPAVDTFGIRPTLIVVTLVLLAIALSAIGLRSLHGLDALQPAGPAEQDNARRGPPA